MKVRRPERPPPPSTGMCSKQQITPLKTLPVTRDLGPPARRDTAPSPTACDPTKLLQPPSTFLSFLHVTFFFFTLEGGSRWPERNASLLLAAVPLTGRKLAALIRVVRQCCFPSSRTTCWIEISNCALYDTHSVQLVRNPAGNFAICSPLNANRRAFGLAQHIAVCVCLCACGSSRSSGEESHYE